MLKKNLLLATITLLLFASIAQADPADVVYHDLSLAGYRLGMTYDEAFAIRPFHVTQNPVMNSEGGPIFKAFIYSVYIDEVEQDLILKFQNEKVFMVIARVTPLGFEGMIERFQDALGKGENKSKVHKNYEGKEIRQTVYLWEFPNAEMWLYETSSVPEYATISLSVKRERSDASVSDQ